MSATAGNGAKTKTPVAGRRARLRTWLPLAIIVGLTVVAYTLGWNERLSFKAIGLNYEILRDFIDAHTVIALLIYTAVYSAIIALSLPVGLLMTLAGGLLFGWLISAPATIVGATIGATIVFLAARTSLGAALAARASPWLCKLSEGFKANALSYLLFLRLVPAFPFCIVNVVPALLGIPLRTFVLGTVLGIIPGTYAIAVAGAGLASVIEAQNAIYRECLAQGGGSDAECPYNVDTSALITTEILFAFALLGIVALIPVVIDKWSKRNASA